ncbi:hypothetical protein N9937_00025 [bacterium]|nr:hypothetical protein [bacterium]
MTKFFDTTLNKTTDPSLSAADRGVQSAHSLVSLDWNESTGEYNPFPVGTESFHAYDDAYEMAMHDFIYMHPNL